MSLKSDREQMLAELAALTAAKTRLERQPAFGPRTRAIQTARLDAIDAEMQRLVASIEKAPPDVPQA